MADEGARNSSAALADICARQVKPLREPAVNGALSDWGLYRYVVTAQTAYTMAVRLTTSVLVNTAVHVLELEGKD